MKTQVIGNSTINTLPFIVGYVEKIEEKIYYEAINNSKILKESYDPKTQTSNIPIYAGTSLTYSDTGGLWSDRDTKESDT